MAARQFDVVVWGASGFTGKRVCEHLAVAYQVGVAGIRFRKALDLHHSGMPGQRVCPNCTSQPPTYSLTRMIVWDCIQGRVRWAMAGRNQAKLEAVRESLLKFNPACKVGQTQFISC
jgi:short subunit dehydrogenase-like uncharacterized protein